jgi:hypothetical protein
VLWCVILKVLIYTKRPVFEIAISMFQYDLPKVCFQRLLGKDFYIGRKQGKHLICWQFLLCCDASFKCMGLESTSMSLYLTSLGCQKEVSTTKQKQRVSLSVPDQSRPVLK